jgi:glutamate synthase (NADPH/NADH) large chain
MTQIRDERAHIAEQGMYDSSFEHDNCGIGAVVNIKGIKTHKTVSDALRIVENLEHRAGKDAEGKTGDGVGILLQISHKFFKKAAKELGVELGEERDYGIGMFFFPQNELQRKQAMKDWNSSAGEKFRRIRESLDIRLSLLCHILCRHL